MAKQQLHTSQVRTRFNHMCCVAMAQHVWRNRLVYASPYRCACERLLEAGYIDMTPINGSVKEIGSLGTTLLPIVAQRLVKSWRQQDNPILVAFSAPDVDHFSQRIDVADSE